MLRYRQRTPEDSLDDSWWVDLLDRLDQLGSQLRLEIGEHRSFPEVVGTPLESKLQLREALITRDCDIFREIPLRWRLQIEKQLAVRARRTRVSYRVGLSLGWYRHSIPNLVNQELPMALGNPKTGILDRFEKRRHVKDCVAKSRKLIRSFLDEDAASIGVPNGALGSIEQIAIGGVKSASGTYVRYL
jgi:hypothetical protein